MAGHRSPFHFSPRPNRAHEIHWHEWNDATFRLAQAEDKPVFLDLTAVWCHWCHVLDEITLSDLEVIRALNERYIPVRVDNDRRPDINERYNQGGWPTTAFLTPTGELLGGATYLTPEQMRPLLTRIADYYRENREQIAAEIARLRSSTVSEATRGQLSKSMVDVVAEAVSKAFEPTFGGFGQQMKFPNPEAVAFALRRHHLTGDQRMLEIAVRTLDAMAAAGICDQVEGGFFRYSTTPDWSIPHFEKMLEINAGLLANYAEAYHLTQAEHHRQTAQGIMEFLEQVLLDGDRGVFGGSQDADEEYFQLAAEQRAQREAPYVDRTVYVSWNAMAASAYLAAYRAIGGEQLLELAQRVTEFLLGHCHRPKAGMCRYHDGQPQLFGLLGDQAYMVRALLDLHEASGEAYYLNTAEEIAAFVCERLSSERGGFRDRPSEADALGALRVETRPFIENSVMGGNLARMARLTGKQDYLELARSTLEAFAPDYADYGYFAASYALAVERVLQDPVEMVIVGSPLDTRARELRVGCLRIYEPRRELIQLDPAADAERIAERGFPAGDRPTLYVCIGRRCSAPISDPAQIPDALASAPI